MAYKTTVFISHSWAYSEHYEKLREWIFERRWNVGGTPLVFQNSSVPKDDPIHNAPNAFALRREIYRLIQLSHVVVIPTGMYSSYSKWIQEEISGAQHFRVPILAVNPWAQQVKSSVVSKAASTPPVGWTSKSVVSGVWSLRNR